MNPPEKTRKKPRWGRRIVLGLLAAAVLVAGYFFFAGGSEAKVNGSTYTVRRGDLEITVTEGGSIEALENQTIRSEVQGQTKILSIVEEGYQVTPEDVENGKVLVELDGSELEERHTQQEIEFQSAQAGFTEARESYEIQIKQNESDIKSAQLKVKFARMDFEKYLGEETAREILALYGLDEVDLTKPVPAVDPLAEELESQAATSDLDGEDAPQAPPEGIRADGAAGAAAKTVETGNVDAAPEAGSELPGDVQGNAAVTMASAVAKPAPQIDFAEYATDERLGDGEAQEELRKLQSNLLLAEEDLKLAENTLEGTKDLKEKGYVTQQEYDADEMKVMRNRNSAEAAGIAAELFVKYEFPKQCEQLLSDYQEAIRDLEVTWKQAVSKLAQAEARLKSSEAQYKLRAKRLQEITEQIDKCVIRAERPGLVVYAGSDRPWRNENISEGATVYERQDIITIPDMTQMAVEVKIHESAIKQVEKGQKALVRLDAFPDQVLEGEVMRVGAVPDSGQRWLNPDLKLYRCTVSIDGTYEWLKPGMSAEVEIKVDTLKNVLSVPVTAVTSREGSRVVYLASALGDPASTPIETGAFNESFIEVLSGLEEGDKVMLHAPAPTQEEGDAIEGPGEEEAEETAEGGEADRPSATGEGSGGRPPRRDAS